MGQQQYLPMDIICVILLCLPVKTLSRFRCVCKSWFSLISSPQFQQLHYLNRIPSLLRTQKCGSDKEMRTITLHLSTHSIIESPPLNDFFETFSLASKYHPLTPIQSCQGLVCLVSYDRVFLCNPSTQELMALPVLPPLRGGEFNHCFGLGYSDSTKEFKVVRFFTEPCPGELTYCEVFTLGTDRWRQTNSPPQYCARSSCAPFLSQAFHLLPAYFRSDKRRDDMYIYAFSVDEEDYTRIPFPKFYYTAGCIKDLRDMCLTELRGSLCLTFQLLRRHQLWILYSYNEGDWTKLYNIDLSPLVTSYSLDLSCFKHGSVVMADGTLLVNVLSDKGTAELVRYDPKDNVVKDKIGIDCSVTFYVESFFSLGSR